MADPEPTPVQGADGFGAPFSGALLRALRHEIGVSQEGFAAAVRKAGAELGEPNKCTKRLVQKWEHGEHARPHPKYRRAITAATGTPWRSLCEQTPAVYVSLPKRLDRIIDDLIRVRNALTPPPSDR